MTLFDFTFKVFTEKSAIPFIVKYRYESLKQALNSLHDKFPNNKYQLINCEEFCEACQ